MSITLPLESVGVLRKDGKPVEWKHTKMVTGEIGQEAAEAFLELAGGSAQGLVDFLDEEAAKAAV